MGLPVCQQQVVCGVWLPAWALAADVRVLSSALQWGHHSGQGEVLLLCFRDRFLLHILCSPHAHRCCNKNLSLKQSRRTSRHRLK